MIDRVTSACWRVFKVQIEDLPAFALAQTLILALGLGAAKYLAVRHAFGEGTFTQHASLLAQVMPCDFLLIGGLIALALLLRGGPRLSARPRAAVFVAIQVLAILWIVLSFINVELYKSLGSPLKYHLLVLAPTTMKYLFLSGVVDKRAALLSQGMLLALAVASGPLLFHLIRPYANRRHWAQWSPVLLLLGTGALLAAAPARGFRESALRDMNVFKMFIPEQAIQHAELAPPTELERNMLKGLCGPDQMDGMQTFGKLPKKKYNVVVWFWESVGLRYLKSQHPLGECRTPRLDLMIQNGALRFSQCYVECPFTAQSGWALLTGISPPARPVVFTYAENLPRYGPLLGAEFKRLGYHTSHFNCSHTQIGRVDKILAAAGFDVFEDCENLPNLGRYAQQEWGVEDAAIVERLGQWLDGLPAQAPFMSLLWNIDTHYPYKWPNMPADLQSGGELARYQACIEHSDAALGKLHDLLASRKLLDDTIIVIVGDHGEGMGRPPRPYERGHSMMVFEDSIHVPLLFLHPGFKGEESREIGAPSTITDIFPTLMDVVGGPAPVGIDGRSLAKPRASGPFLSRSIIWWPASIRAGRFKLVMDRAEGSPELYDLHSDPREAVNVIDRHVDIANTLISTVIRATAQRLKTDPSFDFGFSFAPELNPDFAKGKARPTISDLIGTPDK